MLKNKNKSKITRLLNTWINSKYFENSQNIATLFLKHLNFILKIIRLYSRIAITILIILAFFRKHYDFNLNTKFIIKIVIFE